MGTSLKYIFKHSISTHIQLHLYEYIHIYPMSMNIFKRLDQLNLEIYEIDHQERFTIIRNVNYH
jgi:hypothetical protein